MFVLCAHIRKTSANLLVSRAILGKTYRLYYYTFNSSPFACMPRAFFRFSNSEEIQRVSFNQINTYDLCWMICVVASMGRRNISDTQTLMLTPTITRITRFWTCRQSIWYLCPYTDYTRCMSLISKSLLEYKNQQRKRISNPAATSQIPCAQAYIFICWYILYIQFPHWITWFSKKRIGKPLLHELNINVKHITHIRSIFFVGVPT